jgi:hypothetical protein
LDAVALRILSTAVSVNPLHHTDRNAGTGTGTDVGTDIGTGTGTDIGRVQVQI